MAFLAALGDMIDGLGVNLSKEENFSFLKSYLSVNLE